MIKNTISITYIALMFLVVGFLLMKMYQQILITETKVVTTQQTILMQLNPSEEELVAPGNSVMIRTCTIPLKNRVILTNCLEMKEL